MEVQAPPLPPPGGAAGAAAGGMLDVQVVPTDTLGDFAVLFMHDGEQQELSPLEEGVARWIADCLRIKMALDAGAPPLEQLPLSQPLDAFAHLLDDLRAEPLEAVMQIMAAGAAVVEDEGEASVPADPNVEGPAPPQPPPPPPQVPAHAAASPEEGEAVHEAVPMLPPEGAAESEPPAPAALAAASGGRAGALPPEQREKMGGRARPATSAQPDKQGQAAQPPQEEEEEQQQEQPQMLPPPPPKRRAKAKAGQDELLARRLQQQLTAEMKYERRPRRAAAPAEGSCRLPSGRRWATMPATGAEGAPGVWSASLGNTNPAGTGSQWGGAEDGSGAEQEPVEFAGVEAVGGGGEGSDDDGEEAERWRAILNARLDKQKRPKGDGVAWRGPVCECDSAAEAAVARDLALLWREGRLGYLQGDLSWQKEEYNFGVGDGYWSRGDLTPRLHRCTDVGQLRALLAELAEAGTLAELAASLERNPLSRTVPPPLPEPPSEATKQRYVGVKPSGTRELPWRAMLELERGDRLEQHSLGFPTSAQAAVVADLGALWSSERGEDAAALPPVLNFSRQLYEQDEEVWGRLRAADCWEDLSMLFGKLRRSGRLQQLVERQAAAPAVPDAARAAGTRGVWVKDEAPAAADEAWGRDARKRRRSIQPAAPAASAPPPRAPTSKRANSTAPYGYRGTISTVVRTPGANEAQATPPARAATQQQQRQQQQAQAQQAETGAACPTCGVSADVADAVLLMQQLLDVTETEAGRDAHLTVELAATYMMALQAAPDGRARTEIAVMQEMLHRSKWGGVVAGMRAAVQLAGLELELE